MITSKIRSSNGRNSARHYEWRYLVKKRDGECKNCGSKEKLHAHHIIPWKINESLRFDISNGITLCSSCHRKIEFGFKKNHIPWNKGRKLSDETKRKLSNSLKGRKVWNKGIKGLIVSPETQFKKGQIPWNKGKTSIPEERICKICGINKKIKMFTPQQRGKFYSHICKECRNQGSRVINDSKLKCNK